MSQLKPVLVRVGHLAASCQCLWSVAKGHRLRERSSLCSHTVPQAPFNPRAPTPSEFADLQSICCYRGFATATGGTAVHLWLDGTHHPCGKELQPCSFNLRKNTAMPQRQVQTDVSRQATTSTAKRQMQRQGCLQKPSQDDVPQHGGARGEGFCQGHVCPAPSQLEPRCVLHTASASATRLFAGVSTRVLQRGAALSAPVRGQSPAPSQPIGLCCARILRARPELRAHREALQACDRQAQGLLFQSCLLDVCSACDFTYLSCGGIQTRKGPHRLAYCLCAALSAEKCTMVATTVY